MTKFRNKYPSQSQIEQTYFISQINLGVPIDSLVFDYTKLNQSNPDYLWLIACCGVEARGETQAGIKAVCDVVLNRLYQQKSYFGYSIPEIITKETNGLFQFSGMNPNNPSYKWLKSPKPSELLKVSKPVFESYLNITHTIQDKRVCYFKHKSAHYGKWADKLKQYNIIGNHEFYLDESLSK